MWKTVKLGDVIEKGETINPTTNPDIQFSYIDVSSIDRVSFSISETQTLLGKDAPSRARRAVRTGDVLFATIRPTLQRVAIVPKNLNGEVCSTGYIVLRPKASIICSKFIFYYMLSEKVKAEMEGLQTGASYPAVNDTQVKNLNISYPPLAEQQRIVAKLDAAFAEIDGAIKITDDKLSNYTDLSSSIMREILNNDLFRWETKNLSHLSENLDAKRIPITKSKRAAGNVPYYGASGIVDYVKEYLFDDDLLLISEDGANLLMRTYPIAFSVSGKCWVNNHAHVLKFENPKLQEWVELYLNATNLSPYISGMAQPKLNQKKLNEIPIPCPDGEMLERLLNIVASAKEHVENILLVEEKKTNELKKLKSVLLAQELQSEAA